MERFSMNEFQPLSLMEKQQRIMDKILKIDEDKRPIIIRKQEIELELGKYNDEVRGKQLEPKDYEYICKLQNALKMEKMDIERKLSQFKDDARKLQTEEHNIHLQLKRIPDGKAKEKMLEIRDKYMSFAADTTRVSSMRAMASRFVEEIQLILTDMP